MSTNLIYYICCRPISNVDKLMPKTIIRILLAIDIFKTRELWSLNTKNTLTLFIYIMNMFSIPRRQ